MGLPWVRLDSNIASHDKTWRLMSKGARGRSAFTVYVCALGWCGAHGTNGHVPRDILAAVHGRPSDASTLVEVGLFDPDPDGDGWWIRNYLDRQQSREVSELTRGARRRASRIANCRRWHTQPCDRGECADD